MGGQPTSPGSDLQAFLKAIAQQESGGNYNEVNSSSGALGKYQVLPSNVADWTRQALGRSLSPDEFLHSPSAQEAVANTILGGYFRKYGAAGAAAMWYSGQPDPTKTYGHPSVASYVKDVLALMKKFGGSGGSGQDSGGGLLGGVLGGNLLSLPKEVTDFFTALEKPLQAMLWIVNPTHWARIIAAVFGFLLLGAGLITLMKAA